MHDMHINKFMFSEIYKMKKTYIFYQIIAKKGIDYSENDFFSILNTFFLLNKFFIVLYV